MRQITNRADRAIGRVALALTGLVLLGVGITALMAWRGVAARPPAFAAGERVDMASRFYDGHDVTVILVVKTGCPACERSAAFHREVIDAATAAGLAHELVVTDTTPVADLGRVHVAPSILIVDRRGILLEMKEGALPEAEQRALIERVRKSYLP